MKNNCSTCKYCVYKNTEVSPGGMITVFNYECENENSYQIGQKMNLINGHRGSQDSRENNTCDKYLKK